MASKKTATNRVTFRQDWEASRRVAERNLMKRARIANGLAKIASTSSSRKTAYQVKHKALNRGLELSTFIVRSDEQGRSHLVRVLPRNGAALHLPIGELSVQSQEKIQVKAVLGRLNPEAA